MERRTRTIFRPEALERLSAPERLDVLLRLQERRRWVPLAVLAGLLVVIAAWSVLGRIPVFAEGRGVLVHQREVVDLQSPGAGYVSAILVTEGEEVAPETVIAHIDRPDLQTRLDAERDRLARLLAGARSSGSASADASFAASRRIADRKREEVLATLRAERARLDERLEQTAELTAARRERLESQHILRADGLLADSDLVEAEEALVRNLDRAETIEQRIDELAARELAAEEDYFERVQEISDDEDRVAQVRGEIAALESRLSEEGVLVAGRRGRLLELSCGVGSYLAPGQRVGTLAASDEATPLVGLAYFTVRDGKRLMRELPAQVSPDHTERERFGSMQAQVRQISEFPVRLEAVEHLVGHRGLAESLAAGERRIQVWMNLQEDVGAPSGYVWSSSRGPTAPVTAGTTADVRVVVEERAPITFLLPFLRRASGVRRG